MALREAVFGLAGSLSVFPVKSEFGDPVSVATASIISARIYTAYPSEAQILDDANGLGSALQYLTAWANGDEVGEKTIAYTAIPQPTYQVPYVNDYEVYYVVLSWRAEGGADILRNVEPFLVRRPGIVETGFNVVAQDCYDVESKLQSVFASKIASKITLAETLTRVWLVGVKKMDLRRLDLDSAKLLVVFQAVVLACLDLANQGSDEWLAKHEAHTATLKMLQENLPLRYDTNSDGVVTPGEKVSQGYGLFIR